MQPSDHKFNWGETVRVISSAPAELHPGKIASVCGVVKIDEDDVAVDPSLERSTWLYLIEFGNGTSIELTESHLEKYTQ